MAATAELRFPSCSGAQATGSYWQQNYCRLRARVLRRGAPEVKAVWPCAVAGGRCGAGWAAGGGWLWSREQGSGSSFSPPALPLGARGAPAHRSPARRVRPWVEWSGPPLGSRGSTAGVNAARRRARWPVGSGRRVAGPVNRASASRLLLCSRSFLRQVLCNSKRPG